MTTQRLYYTDSSTWRFSTQVLETTTYHDKPAVVLDQTYFYPTGGGQPHDTGTLGDARVIDVVTRADDKAVLHVLDGAAPTGKVNASIDGARRFDHMQQHTGQHILTQAFVQTCEANTVGFHLGESVTIDLDAPTLTAEQITRAESLANTIVTDNRAVTTRIIDPNDADGVRMRRVPEALATGLRVVEVTDFDTTACGGTHVRSTGEIGMIKVLRTEKYKGGTRVEFACGGRALREFGRRVAVTAQLTADLSCALDDLPTIVGAYRAAASDSEKTIKALRERLIEYEARDLIATAAPHGEARLVLAVYDGRDAAELRLLAARIVREDGMLALLGLAGEKSHVICARSADLPRDMNELLKRALEPLGGRGGGGAVLAQGGGGAATIETMRAALTAALEG
jgi:alanyl-tRNA synthetase